MHLCEISGGHAPLFPSPPLPPCPMLSRMEQLRQSTATALASLQSQLVAVSECVPPQDRMDAILGMLCDVEGHIAEVRRHREEVGGKWPARAACACLLKDFPFLPPPPHRAPVHVTQWRSCTVLVPTPLS